MSTFTPLSQVGRQVHQVTVTLEQAVDKVRQIAALRDKLNHSGQRVHVQQHVDIGRGQHPADFVVQS